MIPESFLREVEERNDIVELVSSYVSLTKRSGQNMFGLCPFHSEKSPSFSVSSSRRIYHCFGCGKGGSVINFVMEIENLNFPEAVEFLAKRAGLTMPEREQDERSKQRERLFALHKEAARFYYGELVSGERSNAAREYMQRRGIGKKVAKNFGIGAAPDSWDALLRAMKAKGYTEEELFQGGLVRRGKNGGFYDVFRDRLVFPVIDVRGNVIGFSGRALGDGEPKYLNSPETPIFSKTHNLFGLNLAKKSKSGHIILVEGNIDVIALHQAGFDSAVASLGTSLTGEQARLMSRYTQEVVIAFDADKAGQSAAKRAIGLLEKLDLGVKVLSMEGAKDPDEYIEKFGADAFANLLSQSEHHVDYRLQRIKAQYDMTTDEGKLGYLREATELVAGFSNAVERELYAMRIAADCTVSVEAVMSELKKLYNKAMKREKARRDTKAMRPVINEQPRQKGVRFENMRSASAEKGVIQLAYYDCSLFQDLGELSRELFSSELLWEIYKAVHSHTSACGTESSMAVLAAQLSPEQTEILTEILDRPVVLANGATALRNYIETMEQERSRKQGADSPEALIEYVNQRRKQENKGYGG